MAGNIDPIEFGALQAKMEVMTHEMHQLRETIQRIQTTLDRGHGGIMVIMFAVGSLGSFVALYLKKIFGG